ncbi:coiled-coil domain-containing 92B-like [Synchiropus picturatus]
MDAVRLEQQVASVERGIVFLKQEHLVLLAGLQAELTHLSRRCHELSCELDSRFPGRSTAGEEAELAARCEAVQRLLEDQQSMTVTARGELRAGRARASALGRSLREEERHFLEELKRRSHKITLLSRELQRQKDATTSLCHQLHSARLQLSQQSPGAEEEGPEEEEEGPEEEGGDAQEEEDDQSWLLTPPPPPPPEETEDGRRRRRLREERVRACVPLERVTAPQRALAMPDPALFLVPLRYRLLRWSPRPQEEDEWEDLEESGPHRRVDLGAAEGETAL